MNLRAVKITMDWMHGKTFEELAKEHGISHGRAAQIKDEVFRKIGWAPWAKSTIMTHHNLRISMCAQLRSVLHGDPDRFDPTTPAGMFREILCEEAERDRASAKRDADILAQIAGDPRDWDRNNSKWREAGPI